METKQVEEISIVFEPKFDPQKKRRKYGVTLRSVSGSLLGGIKLRFNLYGLPTLEFPDHVELTDEEKLTIKALVKKEMLALARKQNTGAIEDKYLLGCRITEASIQVLLRRINLN